jgi:hypothetical protein
MAADRRNRLIGECVAAAQSAIDAAATAVAWSERDDSETEVEIFSGTRAAERVTAGERDGRAREVLSELRQRLVRLENLYPCDPAPVLTGGG